MTEPLNHRLERIESEIESLSDKINQIKPADINKKQVAKLIDDLSLQLKSIKQGVSEDNVKSMLSDLKSNIPKPGLSKKDVIAMISYSISENKPKKIDISEEIKDAINQSVTRDFVNKLYRGAK